MAAPTTVLTVIKKFTYRGVFEEWSNTYAFTGSTPADSSAWRVLFDALVAEEKKLYTSSSMVVAGYGYDGIPTTGDHAIWSVDMSVSPNSVVPGTLALGSDYKWAGDQAAWIRWGLDRYNTNGKRVYLRKYFHGGTVSTSNSDNISTTTDTAYAAFGTKMMDGTFATSRKICDKDGAVPIGTGHSSFITTRTLKRRGKRPPT